MKAWEANSVLFFLPTIWWLEALKRREKIIRENAFKQKKKNRLKFNPGLALIGFRTTGSCFFGLFCFILFSQRCRNYSLDFITSKHDLRAWKVTETRVWRMTHLVEPNENNGQIILLCQTLWDDNDNDHNYDVGYKSFFFLFWSQWFFAHFRNCPINTGLGRRTSCRDKRWSHQIWGTWCSKITHSSGPPHIRFLVPIKAFLASLEISVIYISSTCTSWFLSKTDTFLTGATCPSYRDVRLIESQLKWAKNGRDKL